MRREPKGAETAARESEVEGEGRGRLAISRQLRWRETMVHSMFVKKMQRDGMMQRRDDVQAEGEDEA